MYNAILLLAVFAALAALGWGVVRAMLRAWLARKVRIALLETLQSHPELRPPLDALDEVLDNAAAVAGAPARQDYAITGATIAILGVAAVILGLALRVGEVAVGAFVGGALCLWVGVPLTILGALIRLMTRSPLRKRKSRNT
ncbi:MAG TPA: hypothetical protein HPP83_00345 [Candidatus Hydrogenedentes bacterium]|nr:hypothetical protein [Candidatus Hydrogenedentota bacterium]